jgi:hypothetical protein
MGGSFRKKEGVTCKSFSELMSEMNRLWNLSKLEKTDEHITLQVKQETYTSPTPPQLTAIVDNV